jgi:hypothetical protein
VPGREIALTRSSEPVEKEMNEPREPKDKLDATTNVVVNGPEDAPFDWRAVDWPRVEGDVRRLRQRDRRRDETLKPARLPELDG